MKTHLAVFLVLAALPAAVAGQDKRDLPTVLKELGPIIDPQSDQGKTLPTLVARDIKARRDAVNKEDSKQWHELKTRDDWEKFKQPRLEALKRSLGKWPEPPRDLKVRVTKTLDGEGFKIDNLVFESRPGLLVTANLYRPVTPTDKMPGILIFHSHHNPKTEGELQDMGMTWARQGCVVLVMDQLGHGERRQHPFSDAKAFPEAFKVGRQDYYFRYNVAAQLHLVGESQIGWMVWDMMRGVDLLYQIKGIDKERIILLGSVAGGGDPAAVTAALDQRITVAVPFNFGGPQPETTFPLPEDADASFNYLGGGSWESTRNLRLSGAGGFAPWVIVASIAPRRLIYAHEFAWDKDKDPVWKRLNKVYQWYGVPERLSSTSGKGSVSGKPPDSTHCNNIGAVHRVAIHAAFKKWFDMPIPEEYKKRLPADDLRCLTPEIAKEMKTVHVLAREMAARRVKELAAFGAKERRDEALRQWGDLLDLDRAEEKIKATSKSVEINLADGSKLEVEKVVLPRPEVGLVVPVLILLPPKQEVRGIVVGIAHAGRDGFLKQRTAVVAGLLKEGLAVCLPDLRGTGDTKSEGGRGRASTATSLSSAELMLDGPMLGKQVRDLQEVLHLLDKRFGEKPILLWGDSFAPVNAADAKLAVPHELKQPQHAEPMGGLVVLMAALFEENVKAVYVRGGLSSYASLLDGPFFHVPHDAIMPGALTTGDLPDLVRVLAPLAVRLEALVDGQNRLVSNKILTPTYQRALEAFEPGRLTVRAETLSDAQLAAWFVEQVKAK
jgi:cephalosporin-C deacetylase-like acetyl esterase